MGKKQTTELDSEGFKNKYKKKNAIRFTEWYMLENLFSFWQISCHSATECC